MSTHKTIKASKIKALKVESVDLDSFDEFRSGLDLKNKHMVTKLLTQMFAAGDHDAFMELLYVGKREMSKRAKIPEKRSTILKIKPIKHHQKIFSRL